MAKRMPKETRIVATEGHQEAIPDNKAMEDQYKLCLVADGEASPLSQKPTKAHDFRIGMQHEIHIKHTFIHYAENAFGAISDIFKGMALLSRRGRQNARATEKVEDVIKHGLTSEPWIQQ